jgi:dihydroorotate dehydrogenase
MIITMKENKIKEILAKSLGYEMREFNPDYFSLEDLEEKIKEFGLNPKQIIEDYKEEEKKKQEEEYNKYFGENKDEEDEEEEDFYDDEYY